MENQLVKQLQDTIEQLKAEIFRLNWVISELPGDVYWKDKNGTYLEMNKHGIESLRKMGFKWTKSDIIGKTDYDLFDKKTADMFTKNDLHVMENNVTTSKEEATRLPSGKEIVQLSTKCPLVNIKNEIVGIIGNTVDITFIKSLEKKLKIAKERAEKATHWIGAINNSV